MAIEPILRRKQLVITVLLGAVLIFLTPQLMAVGQDSPPVSQDSSPIFDGIRTETLSIAPVSLAPQGQPGALQSRYTFVPRPDGEVAVRSIDWQLVDGDGNAVPSHRASLQRMELTDTGRRDQVCSSDMVFATTGAELSDLSLPDPYAYRSPYGSAWIAGFELVNNSDEALDVTVQYTVSYTDGRVANYLDVEPYPLGANGCFGPDFFVPGDGGPGSVFEQSQQYRALRDATVVAGIGQLRAGGIDVSVTDGDGNDICTATAVYGGQGGHHLADIDQCGSLDRDVDLGEALIVTARYPNDVARNVSATMLLYLRHTGPPPPPAQISIVDVEANRDGFTVELDCNLPLDVSVYVSVTQTKGQATVNGSGGNAGSAPCEPGGDTIVVPLQGDGILVNGRIDYEIEVYGQLGRGIGASDYDTGQTRMRGRLDLVTAQPDQGPLDIVTDPRVGRDDDGNLVVTVRIPCTADDDAYSDVRVTVAQRSGREYLFASGYAEGREPCENGSRTYVITTSTRDRFDSGAAFVTTSAAVYEPEYTYSTRSTSVNIDRGPRLPRLNDFEPDPESALTIDNVFRRNGVLVAQVTYEGCRDDSSIYIEGVAEAKSNRRAAPPQLYGYTFNPICVDGSIEAEVEFRGDVRGNRAGIRVTVSEQGFDGQDYYYESATNADQFRIGK